VAPIGVYADVIRPRAADTVGMEFRSGDALLVFDDDLRIVAWNHGAEDLTGIPAAEAVGRPCWEVLGGVDQRGSLVCHPGCSGARLAGEGWPVRCQRLLVKSHGGRRKVDVSTIAVRSDCAPMYVHVLRDGLELSEEEVAPEPTGPRPRLTARELEVLELVGRGCSAKAIARQLGIAEPTVRNHIRAVLVELRVHSQLAAVAAARRWRLLD
jgi:PAS domain S-box-containing protein